MPHLIINFLESSLRVREREDEIKPFFRDCIIGDFAPWPSCPDLLVCDTPTERLWVGMSYQVQLSHREKIRTLAESIDSRFIVYDATSAKCSIPPYADESEEIHFLEIRWSTSLANISLFAQLAGDTWLYSSAENRNAVGIVLHSVDEIEREFGVTLDRSLIS